MNRWHYLTVHCCRLKWLDSQGRGGDLSVLKVDRESVIDFNPLLLELGDKGWELVSTLSGHMVISLIFKRPQA